MTPKQREEREIIMRKLASVLLIIAMALSVASTGIAAQQSRTANIWYLGSQGPVSVSIPVPRDVPDLPEFALKAS